jgi:hypothetical protein
LGHIPLIDANPRRDQARKQELLDEQIVEIPRLDD